MAVLVCLCAPATAAPQNLATCATVEPDAARLACYDRLAGRAAAAPPAAPPAEAPSDSPLGERWAIGTHSRGVAMRPHEPTYLLFGRYTDNVNQRPGSPTRPAGPADLGLREVEAKFQLSFKFRVADPGPAWAPDVWVGYTQQSQWQVYNPAISRPFRETNYAPEAMFAWHPNRAFGPLRWRLLNVGVMHQSNGRSEVLSRSWNRVYAQFGFEAGNLMLLVRPWARLSEAPEKDDNPDIKDFLGHGDVMLGYRWREHRFAAKVRQNFGTGRGYGEASWRFPLAGSVGGYLQLTSGYGESLIDYNRRQNTVGLGVSLFDWQ